MTPVPRSRTSLSNTSNPTLGPDYQQLASLQHNTNCSPRPQRNKKHEQPEAAISVMAPAKPLIKNSGTLEATTYIRNRQVNELRRHYQHKHGMCPETTGLTLGLGGNGHPGCAVLGAPDNPWRLGKAQGPCVYVLHVTSIMGLSPLGQ